MRICFSDEKRGRLAIAGHAGCGHSNSLRGSVQDDSAGLAVVLALFQEATGLGLEIGSIEAEPGLSGFFRVRTQAGGEGYCRAKRGLTVQEARLARGVVGREALRTQTLVMDVFGRCGGQGTHEAPVALQTAIANAALDTFVRAFPDRFVEARESIPGSCGRIAGTVLDIGGVPVSVLATVNAADDGTGPVEDLEGNVFALSKKAPMAALGMDGLPTIVVESKVYASAYSDAKDAPYFLVRADPVSDNPVVAEALAAALAKLSLPHECRDDVLVRAPGELESKTRALAEEMLRVVEQFGAARRSAEKTRALSELGRLVSEEAGGVSFMSDTLHGIVGGAGLMPGTTAVLSLAVPKQWRDANVLPFLTEKDVRDYVRIVKSAVGELDERLPRALDHLNAHAYRDDLDRLFETSGG